MGHHLDKDGNRVTIDDNGTNCPKVMGRGPSEDVLIEGNHVKKRRLEGIRDMLQDGYRKQRMGKATNSQNYSNVTIRNNYLEDGRRRYCT